MNVEQSKQKHRDLDFRYEVIIPSSPSSENMNYTKNCIRKNKTEEKSYEDYTS